MKIIAKKTQLENEWFDFFPMNRAMSLKTEEDSLESQIQNLRDEVTYLVDMKKRDEAFREKERQRERQQQWEAIHKNIGQ